MQPLYSGSFLDEVRSNCQETSIVEQVVPLKRVLSNTSAVFCFITVFFSMTFLMFIEPILGPQLYYRIHKHGQVNIFDPKYMGFIYAVPIVCYSLTQLLVNLLVDRVKRSVLVFFSIMGAMVSMWILGPSKLLSIRIAED